jgi:hypothetical protein
MTSSLYYSLLILLPTGRKNGFDNLPIYRKMAYRTSQMALLALVHHANLKIYRTIAVFYRQLLGSLWQINMGN